jgi:hypothetical protein
MMPPFSFVSSSYGLSGKKAVNYVTANTIFNALIMLLLVKVYISSYCYAQIPGNTGDRR